MRPPSSFSSKWLKKRRNLSKQLMENGALFLQNKKKSKSSEKY